MPLALQLFGPVQVTWNGNSLKFATEHTRALLAYLAVEADVTHRRTTLATLLWPEVDELTARHNLRQALFLLKQSLAAVPERDTLLQVTQSTVQWHSENVVVDLRVFQEQWRLSYSHNHALDELCPACAERFAQAVALYPGEFLQGLLLKENPLFEEWALLLREQSHRQMLAMLRALAAYHGALGAYDQMQHYAARQVALEPWHEEVHCQLMTALAAQGQTIAALRQYESCRRTLLAELGVPPSAATTALYEAIRSGKLESKAIRQEDKKSRRAKEAYASDFPVSLSSLPQHNLPTDLTPFVGRTRSLAEIHKRLQQGVRLLTLVGPGGMGKTRLAVETGRQQLATYPDGVVFVSLAALISPSGLVSTITTALDATLGVALQGDDLRTTLCQFLQHRRLLLLLDNFEHLLVGSTEGVELVTALLKAAPQLQILVTSRERLQLRSEQLFQVPPLTVAVEATLAEAAATAAVQLFVQSAQFVHQATYAWWQFFLLHGPDAEAQVSFADAIAGVRAQRAPELTAIKDHTTSDTTTPLTTKLLGQRLLATLLAIHAYYLNSETPHVAMAAQAREAMALGAASGGFEGESWGTVILGRALFSFGQHQEAKAMWQQAIQLVKRYQPDHPQNEWLHDANWEAHNWLAAALRQLDDYVGSCAAVEQALQICQALGKRRGELSCLYQLAQLNLFRYDLAAAEKGFVATLALARALNYRRQEMMVQDGLGHVLRLRGDYTTARSLWEEAAGVAAELAAFYDEALIWVALIRLHCQLGDYTAAAQRNERLTHLLTQHNIGQEGELYRYLIAASLAQGAGDQRMALQYVEQASQLTENGEMLFRRIETALSLGHARVAVGEWAGAAVAFQQAMKGFQQFGNYALAAEAQAGLAHVALAQGDHAGARALVEAILPLLTTSTGRPAHVGYNSPFFIYWICYQVLAAQADARAATVLRQGYELLQQEAATLDDATRHCFLEAVPTNRTVSAAYHAWQAQANRVQGPMACPQ